MFADRNNGSSLGLWALLGRFLHGLLPHRFFQLVDAAWSFLMGPWEASSLLPSASFIHRSVRSGELPEVFEVLGLRPGSWEEAGECIEELGPWKELITPDVGVDLDLLKSWKGVSSSKDEESTLEELTTWHRAMVHSNMQVFWEPGLNSWNDVAEPNQENEECHKAGSDSHTFSSDDQTFGDETVSCKVDHKNSGTPLSPSSLAIISYILNVGAGRAFSRVGWKDVQNVDAIVENCSQNEIQHIHDKRFSFLQQSETLESFFSDMNYKDQEQSRTVGPESADYTHLPSLTQAISNLNLDFPMSECLKSQSQLVYNKCELLSDISLTQDGVLEVPEINEKCSPCGNLPVKEMVKSGNIQHICLSSPDNDLGYQSLEYWQCSPLQKNHTAANIETSETCELDRESVLIALPTELSACPPSFIKDKNDQNREEINSGLQDEIHISSLRVCTNRHIGYILGTIVSDDDEDDICSSSGDEWDKEEDDDGFDSEGSLSTTDSETDVPEDGLWNSFCSSDPYSLQNFTASLQTGLMTEENFLSLETLDQHQSDEESWCDSNAESSSESDCSADKGENLKLWNAFLKSDDPYNPICFTAAVQTSVRKNQSSEISSACSEMVYRLLQNHKVTLDTSQTDDLQQLQLIEMHNVPMEDSANLGHKKVTFYEKVTIHYVCNEERKGHWEEIARDRCRFQHRIKETEFAIGHCLTPDHRQRAWERMQGQWCT